MAILTNVSNTIVLQNFIVNERNDSHAIQMQGNNSNILISNNYIFRSNAQTSAISSATTSSLEISQNVIRGNIDIHNSNLTNNILREGNFTGDNNVVLNNIGNADQFSAGNGNQASVDMNTVFVGAGTGSTDAQWQLAAGSPASGTGLNGADIGMFGGASPYVLSGIPPIPAIYFFAAPPVASGSSGTPVQLKIKSNN